MASSHQVTGSAGTLVSLAAWRNLVKLLSFEVTSYKAVAYRKSTNYQIQMGCKLSCIANYTNCWFLHITPITHMQLLPGNVLPWIQNTARINSTFKSVVLSSTTPPSTSAQSNNIERSNFNYIFFFDIKNSNCNNYSIFSKRAQTSTAAVFSTKEPYP